MIYYVGTYLYDRAKTNEFWKFCYQLRLYYKIKFMNNSILRRKGCLRLCTEALISMSVFYEIICLRLIRNEVL